MVRAKNFFKRFLSFLLMSALIACGGGTSGTGPNETSADPVIIDGFIFIESTPQSDVAVTVLETGEETLTDSSGYFSLYGVSTEEGITLMLSSSRIDAHISLGTIPDGATHIRLEVVLDASGSAVQSLSIQYPIGDAPLERT